jgi:energy-coupling factor transporter ATP-binding protein EcfA2
VNARENPFRSERIEALAFRYLDGDEPTLLAKLDAASWRGAIVGPRGSGKSTLVRLLAREVESRGGRPLVVALSDERRTLPPGRLAVATPATVLFIDGFDLLGFTDRLRIRRLTRVGGLVVTAHGDCGLRTIFRTRTTDALLRELLDELVPLRPPQLADVARRQYAAVRGDIRETFRSLYDWSAGIEDAS